MRGFLPMFLLVVAAYGVVALIAGGLQALGIQVCPECLREMRRGARRCPHCQAVQPERQRKGQR